MAQGWRGSYTRYREFFLNIASLYKQRADLRAFLEIILSLSTIIIFALFALKPTALTIISLLQTIKERETTLATLTQKVNNLKTASSVLGQNQSFVPDINFAVPTLPNPDIFAGQLEGLGVKDSVQIVGISIDQVRLVGQSVIKGSSQFSPLPGKAQEMPFSVIVRGAYPNLISFSKDFENMRIGSKIDSFNINASTSEKGTTVTAVISGRVPFLGN